MERIVYRKTLDTHKNGIQFTLQGFETADKMSRRIEINLMASGDTIDLPLEQIVAMMYVTTPSATEPDIHECVIKDNTIIYDVLPIVEEGITEMQLKLIETRVDGAKGVLATPKFAIEVTESNTNEDGATQTNTYTALEEALAKANGVYNSRLVRIEIAEDCLFRAYYADGSVYESTALNETLLKGEAILSQSYARGGTGLRTGEDTDNSMYYSKVSKGASKEAVAANKNSAELLKETRKHGIYTAFSVDFDTGEVKYISPTYTFCINKNTGELEARGVAFTPEETIRVKMESWLTEKGAYIDARMGDFNDVLKNEAFSRELYDAELSTEITKLNEKVNPIADYIVGYGTDDVMGDGSASGGTWRYVKWKSGAIDLYMTFPFAQIFCGANNRDGFYYSDMFTVSAPDFVSSLYSLSVCGGDSSHILFPQAFISAAGTNVVFWLCSNSSIASATGRVYITARGWWK